MAEPRSTDRLVKLIAVAEDLVHFAVAVVLLGLAGAALYKTGADMIRSDNLAEAMTTGITDVLFVVILMELLRTVVAHFKHQGFQLKPFLIIGIISAVRHILTIGARTALAGEEAGGPFNRTQIALGVNTGVVLGLAVVLLLVRIREPADGDDD